MEDNLSNQESSKILIIDFGSQFTQLLINFYRKGGVIVDISPMSDLNKLDNNVESYITRNYCGIILSGGPGNIKDDFNMSQINDLVNKLLNISPNILGICYGSQLLSIYLGGVIEYLADNNQEYGENMINLLHNNELIFKNIPFVNKVWMSHHDYILDLPYDHNNWMIDITSVSENSIVSSFTAIRKNNENSVNNNIFGLQFHPEVSHTQNGDRILVNFLELCGGHFSDSLNILEDIKLKVKNIVGDSHIILAVSGGVDSTILAILLNNVVGEQIHPIFIDNGLLRYNEVNEIKYNFAILGIDIKVVDSVDIFLERLKGITEPEQKRKIIGHTFIEIFEREANLLKELHPIKWLAQGTIYPDVIESSSRGGKVVIKSHHNVGGLPEHMDLELLEPFREFFKDDIRFFGNLMKVHPHIVNRRPFPGPGLAIRCLGEVTEDRLKILREADDIFSKMLKTIENDIENFNTEVWQSATILLPVKSVGVKGDSRCYQNPIVLRAVNSVNGMTCRPSRLPAEFLENVATQITNRVDGINRVVYDYTSKPPGTIEWE